MRRLWWVLVFILAVGVVPASRAQQGVGTNLDFDVGAEGVMAPGWELGGEGYVAALSTQAAQSGRLGLAIRYAAPLAPMKPAVLRQRIDAAPFRGRRVRLSAMGSVAPAGGEGGRFWLLVEDAGGRTIALANMTDTPIGSSAWTRYSVHAPVTADAQFIHFGFSLFGAGAAMIDDFSIADAGAVGDGNAPPKALSATGLDNLTAFARLFGYVRYFHPIEARRAPEWEALLLRGVATAEPATDAVALRDALRMVFGPIAPSVRIELRGAPLPAEIPGADLIAWRHRGFGGGRDSTYNSERVAAPPDLPAFAELDLPRGLVAFVPLRLPRAATAATPVSPAADKPAGWTPTGDDRTSRLAAIVEAWNVPQHFYPYFDVVAVDWSAQLTARLRDAAVAPDAASFDRMVKGLAAALQDGHASAYRSELPAALPLTLEWIEAQAVVTAVGAGAEGVRVGDVVRAIDGRPTADLIASASALISSSTAEHRRWRALHEIKRGLAGHVASVSLERDGTVVEARVPMQRKTEGSPPAAAPANLSDLAPGIVYVDLRRITDADLQQNLARLAAARALVFDLRGYPSSAAYTVLPHLADRTLRTDQFNIPTYLQPDQRGVSFTNGAWALAPRTPRFVGALVFLTDVSAVSYGESIMGLIEGEKLGPIVGAATAGTNGDIGSVRLITGHTLVWTGLQVRTRDGARRHGVGIRPTVPAQRTIAGVRAGRDELLEAALETARKAVAP